MVQCTACGLKFTIEPEPLAEYLKDPSVRPWWLTEVLTIHVHYNDVPFVTAQGVRPQAG